MGIRREFTCLAHGMFEATEPVCPYGCTSTVERTFTQGSASIGSKKTKQSDSLLNGLATRYGLSDMSNRGGDSVAENRKRTQRNTGPAPLWSSLPKGDRLVVGKGIEHVAGSSGGAQTIGTQLHTEALPGEASFSDIAKSFTQPKPQVIASHSEA